MINALNVLNFRNNSVSHRKTISLSCKNAVYDFLLKTVHIIVCLRHSVSDVDNTRPKNKFEHLHIAPFSLLQLENKTESDYYFSHCVGENNTYT